MLVLTNGQPIQAFPLHRETYKGTPNSLDIEGKGFSVIKLKEAGTLTLTFEGGDDFSDSFLAGDTFAFGQEVHEITCTSAVLIS